MNAIKTIIDTLSHDEKQEFLLLLKRRNRRTDSKNGKLFRLIDAGKTDKIEIALYGKPAKNSYHALCKRLQDSLIDFVASKSFAGETSEELEILKLLLASRIFYEKKQYKIAIKTLSKAEKLAKQDDVYSILNEIYHTKIQYAHLNPKVKLSEIIAASEVNMGLYQQEFRLNKAYAVIKAQVKDSNSTLVSQIISDAFSTFNIKIDTALTYKSLFQLLEITAAAAQLQNDFYTISPFIMQIYEIVSKKGEGRDKHRYYRIQILNLLAITSFRNKKFESSRDFADQMEAEMKKGNRAYYHQFIEKLSIIKALNLIYSGEAALAIEKLNALKNKALDARLLLVMSLFQQSDFEKAYKNLIELNHSDDWYEKKMGKNWVLKKHIIEILLLIEMDKLDLVLARLLSFKRKFSKYLQQIGEQRVLVFMQLVNKYYENPTAVVSTAFKNEVEKSFDWVGQEQEDIFVMSFYAWLKAKMVNEDIYQVTLQLVRGF